MSVSSYCTIHLGDWFDIQQPDCLRISPKHLDLGSNVFQKSSGPLIALYFQGEGNESLQSFCWFISKAKQGMLAKHLPCAEGL